MPASCRSCGELIEPPHRMTSPASATCAVPPAGPTRYSTPVAAPGVVPRRGQAVLHPLEVRQAMGVVPGLHARGRRPAIEVERVATLEDHPVDRRRPAEDAAAGVIDPTAAHERLGLRAIAP